MKKALVIFAIIAMMTSVAYAGYGDACRARDSKLGVAFRVLGLGAYTHTSISKGGSNWFDCAPSGGCKDRSGNQCDNWIGRKKSGSAVLSAAHARTGQSYNWDLCNSLAGGKSFCSQLVAEANGTSKTKTKHFLCIRCSCHRWRCSCGYKNGGTIAPGDLF